jgi:hypothetical protein
MAHVREHDRRTRAVLVLGLLVLGGIVAAAVVLVVNDQDDGSGGAPTTTGVEASSTTAPSSASGPTCSAPAILVALQAEDPSITSVNDFACGNAWAGASFSNPQFDGAALLRAQGGMWVEVDRATKCDDPSIPADVHHYCEVS